MNKIINRSARFEYHIIDEYVAGLILTGPEVKSIRLGKVNISESFVYEKDGELWVKNMLISQYKGSHYTNKDELRERKLLLNKKEILQISKELGVRGISLIPLELFCINNKIKLKIAISKGKKLWDKKESIKKKDLERETGFKLK